MNFDRGWLVYALGGGLGHFQRSLSLARAASRRGVSLTVVTNSPWAPGLLDQIDVWLPRGHRVNIQWLPPDSTPAQAKRRIEPLLSQASALIVDTFPRGLGGELATLLDPFNGLAVWVHRDMTPAYLDQFNIRNDWAGKYDLIISPGERGELSEMALWTPPWLLLNPSEVAVRAQARRTLRLEDSRPTVIVVGSGKSLEVDAFASIFDQLTRKLPDAQVRFAGLTHAEIQWPLFAHLRAADLIVAAGGYNTTHEASALGIPLVGIPQPRMYDRQERRLRELGHTVVEPGDDLEDRVLLAVEQTLSRCAENVPAVPTFQNGADVAVQSIMQALSR